MKPRIHLILDRPDGHRSESEIEGDPVTHDMIDSAEDLLHTITTGERPVFKNIYDLVARAFGISRDAAKKQLYLAAYGGKQLPDAINSDDAEMIAQWIEGYGNEPMDSTIIAKAIRAGRWRAS